MAPGTEGLRALVVGGGIGGLTAALALSRQGARVEVLEQAPAITEVGAGLQISPNGFRVFEALGLGDALADIGTRAEAVELRDFAGRLVLRLDLARLGPRMPYHFVHRADLVALLAEHTRAAGVCIATGARVSKVQDTGSAVEVVLDGDGTRRGDLLVGADGLKSVVRAGLNGPEVPFFTGQVAWRATVPAPAAMRPVATVWMGPARHIVSYPLRGGALANVVAVEERGAWVDEGWDQPGDPDELCRLFAGIAPAARTLLERVETVRTWGLFRHDIAPVWSAGRIALLGDAAHPTLPFLAQGAVMAIEDAWVLADRLAAAGRDGAVPGALAAYVRARRPRVRRIVETANRNARAYHLSSPLVRVPAHAALGLAGRLAPGLMLRRFDWLYRHDVTAGA